MDRRENRDASRFARQARQPGFTCIRASDSRRRRCRRQRECAPQAAPPQLLPAWPIGGQRWISLQPTHDAAASTPGPTLASEQEDAR
jgi:hypothetical protein